MKNTSLLRRVLSVVLTVCMLATLLVPAVSAEQGKGKNVEELSLTPIDPGTLESQKLGKTEADASIEQEAFALTDVVRVSIELDKPGTLAAGYKADGIANNASAKAYREGLRADQEAMTAKIEQAIGGKLDVQWNLTLAANYISANVLYGQIETIKAIPGVKDVFLENRYEPQVAQVGGDEPENGSASYMIGSNLAWAAGYTGAGSKVAIIDTGADSEHQSFSGEGLEYALAQNAEALGLDYDEYVASLNLLTADAIDAVKDQLNANIGSGAAAYRNTKIGYGYNYVDKVVNYIEHINDSQGEHGSHVSGIATANRFIKVDGEYKPALQAVGTQGVAPDAQLVVMKVFGKGGGAYDSDYMVAIEDAIILGCDSANLSLGSGAPGFGFSNGYEDVMNELVENGLVVAFSAGNSGMWYDTPNNPNMAYPYLYIDDNNYATGGSPGSFTNTLATASVDNGGQTGFPLIYGDLHVFYSQTSGYGNSPISTLAGEEYEYVLLNNVGVEDNDYVGNAEYDYFKQLGPEVLEGKIAMCYRGSSSFFAKANAAMAQGAIGIVIINNQAGVINMNLTGYNYTAPAVSILKADGDAIRAQSEEITTGEGYVYYTGTMSIAEEMEVQVPEISDTVEVSSFSSYGTPGTMVLKPEILTPGGSIYSVWGANIGADAPTSSHEDYEVMSGTSMASPQTAGMAAVLGQYIRENDLCAKTGLSQRQLINSLLMSTAHPVYDSYGDYWPVFRVGAGLANINDAISAKSYILMDEDATIFPDSARDGKVKAELGDDPDYTGEYSFKFTLYPLEEGKQFSLRTDIFTQGVAGNGGYGVLQDTGTMLIGAEVTYEVNGQPYEQFFGVDADVNGDGETNAADAQAILDSITGELAADAAFNAEIADIDGDGKITSADAKALLDSVSSYEFDFNEPVEITVNIKLDEEWVSLLKNRYFTNGFYVEGYTYVEPVADREGAMDVVHSIPIFGYCGSYTDANMLDRTSVIDEAYGTGKEPYIGNKNINYMTVKDASGESSVYMGNPYMVEDKFPADRLAMNSADTIASFTYLNIRNAATLGFAVTDANGKVLYAQATPTWKYSAYYYVNGGTWQNTSPASYNVNKALSAAGVQEGDKVTVGFYALPEYYGIVNAKNNGEVAASGSLDTEGFKAILESGIVGEHAGIKYEVVIDNTAPVVKGAMQDLISGNIFVRAQDDNYIAYVAITNKSGSQVFFEAVPEQEGPGEEIEVPLDLEGVNLPNEVVLLVADYAGNEAAFQVSLGGSGSAEDPNAGLMLGFVTDQTSAAPGSGNRMWEISKDELWYNYSEGTYEGLNVFAKVDFAVRAAEYVDGYVFMACTDGWFRVAELAAMDEVMLVGKFDEAVDAIYDMAFNYKDKTLYALGNDNTVYSVDLLTGALTPVAIITLGGVSGSYAEANKLAIDDNGTFWIGGYGSPSYYAGLYKFKLPEPVEEEEEEDEDSLVSWGFESEAEVAEWTIVDANGDGKTWKFSTNKPNSGSGHIMDTYCSSSTQNDDWAISPAFDLSEVSGAELKVALGNNATSYSENFALYAGTSTEIADMVEIMPEVNICLNGYQEFTVDLSGFVGESEVHVAIRHFDTSDQFYAYADDVRIVPTVVEEPEEPGEVEVLEITAARVGDLGTYNYSNGGAFAWDHNEDVLYMASNYNATQDYDHYLWIINTATGRGARANETQGTGNTSSNASARLYGCVNGLFIVPTEEHLIEPAEEPTDLVVEPEEITVFQGMSAELKVAVLPWTLANKDVTFEIADESVAVVNDKGVVTGVEVGSTTVTVKTVAEPQLTAEVTVNVIVPPEAELRGIIWDEDGKGQAAVFNTNAPEDWEAISVVGQLRWASLVDDKVYGSTADTLYVFDADTYEVESLGGIVSDWIPSDADVLPEDMADAYGALVSSGHVGRVLGICMNGSYLEMMDPELGSLVYFDLSDDFASDPMALISFEGRMDYEDYTNCASYFVMTESGMLYRFIMTLDGYLYMQEIAQTSLDLAGCADVTNYTWASMYYDDENGFIYVAKYEDGSDYAYMYAIDANDPACMGVTGDFNESVWPVVGLYKYTPATDLAMTVKPTDVVLYVGETAEISIKIKLGETNEYEAEIADPAICSFEDGIVTGLKEGETDITITTVDANEAGEHLTETVHVKVKDLAALDLIVKGQVSDAKGDRFTNIMLDGPTAASSGKPAPAALTSGGRGGDLYLGEKNGTAYVLNAETFEPDNSYTVDPYFSTYPPMDVANYPMFVDSTGAQDESKFLFTTDLGWLVKPDYYGWNLSSYLPDMAAIAFAGTDEDSDGTPIYVYYIMTTSGVLYEIPIQYEDGSLNLTEVLETGITVSDASALSMAFVYDANIHGDYEFDAVYGLVVANNEDQCLYFIDFQEEDPDDVVKRIGKLDSTNVSGLIGSFDDLAYVGEEPTPPQPDVDGDLIEGYYFESEDEFNEWTLVDADGDGYNWTWSQNCGSWFSGTPDLTAWAYEGTGCAVTASFINTVGVLTPDNWMVSGPIDLSDAEDDAIVSLYAKGTDPSYAAEKFAIYAGTSNDVSTMTQIGGVFTSTSEYKQYTASLADFVGEDEVYIALRHWNISDMYILAVDQVEVLDNLTTDIPDPGPEPNPDPDPDPNAVVCWSFENDPEAAGWTFIGTDDVNWCWSANNAGGYDYTEFAHDGSYFIVSNSYIDYVGAYQADNWAISPAVELPAEGAKLSFFANQANVEYPEPMDVYIGTSADPDAMTLLQANVSPSTGYDDAWTEYIIDLSDYAGQTVYIAFHDSCYDCYEIWVDRVQVLTLEGDSVTDPAAKNVPAKSYKAEHLSVRANTLGDGVAMVNASAAYAFRGELELTKLGETSNQVVGGTDAIRVNARTGLRLPADETVAADGEVQIVLSEDVAVTNGLLEVTFDAEKLSFVDAISELALKSIHAEEGKILFAYASEDEIAAGSALLTLNFTYEGEELETEVTVKTCERNNDVAVEEDDVVIELLVEPAEDQIFNLTTELKDGDQVVIYNPAAGKALSNETVANFYRAGKDIEPIDDQIINPSADLIWTVSAVEGGIELADAQGHKLSIQNGKNNLPLDSDNTVWEIQKGEGDTVFVVSTTAVGTSGDHKALEWYSNYTEFSAYYLNTSDAQFIMELYVLDDEGGETPPEPPVHECAIAQFEDVIEAYPYGTPEHEAIEWAFTHDPQITSGMNETTFGVGQTLTRAQAATFLYAAAGKPEFDAENAENPFTDVKAGKWYTVPVLWAYSQGLVSGMSADTYGVNGNLTRGQIMVILYAWAGKPSVEGLENPYSDVPAGKWFTDAAIWAYDAGIDTGIEDGEELHFNQSAACVREAMVLYLYRYLAE